jgi:hypothetical protein
LIDKKCYPCPSNCNKCSGGKCASCIQGYVPNSVGLCILRCKLPCRTCIENQPTKCLSCYKGSILFANNCQKDLDCNLDSSCTDCGQGTGFVLVGSKCFKCPVVKNCLQCSSNNPQLCAICSDGYYAKGTKCLACPAICKTCKSSNICNSCVAGYTLPNTAALGFCIAC